MLYLEIIFTIKPLINFNSLLLNNHSRARWQYFNVAVNLTPLFLVIENNNGILLVPHH